MFELHVSDTNVSSGSIPVTWCLNKELLDALAKDKVIDPIVIITVAPSAANRYHITREVRKIVPLKELITYVDFHAAGENNIWGFVSFMGKKNAADKYLHKENGQYMTNILSSDGSDYSTWLKTPSNFDNAVPITVSVPVECFAPEPAKWEKNWVNHFFHDKVVDQCQFRRRRLFAYLVQPLLLFFMAIPKLLPLLVAFLIADRGFLRTLKCIFQPLTYPFGSAFDTLQGSALMFRWSSMNEDFDAVNNPHQAFFYLFKRSWRLPLMPIFLIGFFLLYHVHALWFTLFIIGMSLVLMIMTIIVIWWVLDRKIFSTIGRFFISLLPKVNSDYLWYRNDEAENLLLCSNEKKPLTVSALPRKYRLLTLRFQQAKSLVCRPFSR